MTEATDGQRSPTVVSASKHVESHADNGDMAGVVGFHHADTLPLRSEHYG